jgi:hypothetical protein
MEDFSTLAKRLSNWGRWGKDDQIGTLNLITPEKRRQAAALVRDGVSVSLAGDADTEKAVDNPTPYEHVMLGLGADRIGVAYHGIAHTHLDAWNHINAGGVFYNGYKPDPDAVAKTGHQRNSIINVKNGIFTRGVLIDIPRLKGVPYLEPGTPIYVADLEAWEKQTGIRVSSGRASGRAARRPAPGSGAGLKAVARPVSTRRSFRGCARGTWPSWAATTRSTCPRARTVCRRGPSTTSLSSIWGCRSSTTATSKRWPKRLRPGSDGLSL